MWVKRICYQQESTAPLYSQHFNWHVWQVLKWGIRARKSRIWRGRGTEKLLILKGIKTERQCSQAISASWPFVFMDVAALIISRGGWMIGISADELWSFSSSAVNDLTKCLSCAVICIWIQLALFLEPSTFYLIAPWFSDSFLIIIIISIM